MNKKRITHRKRLRIYKILVLCFFIFAFILPEGMQAMPEIDMRIITTVIGIDRQNDMIHVSAQIVIPSEQNGSATKAVVKEGAKNVHEAIEKMSIQMGRKMELGHCGVIVLGSEFAKFGIKEELGILISGTNISPSAYVISTEGSAFEFLTNANKIDDSSSMGLSNYVSFANKGIHVPMVTILDFLSDTYSISKTCVLPRLTAKSETSAESGEKAAGVSEEDEAASLSPESKKLKMDNIDKATVFKDGIKMADLTVEETAGTAWLDTKSIKGKIQTSKVEINGQEFDRISAYLRNKRLFITPYFKNGTPFIELEMRLFLQVEDKRKYLFDDNTPENKKKVMEIIYNGFKENIKSKVESAVIKSKEINSDIFGFTNKFYQRCYKEFMQYNKENSDKLLSELVVDYVIKIYAT